MQGWVIQKYDLPDSFLKSCIRTGSRKIVNWKKGGMLALDQ
ncbi:hypothetical protein EYZ11_012718 [Aspergillus tanneri]|uniref:Uncharacterized protein n=1 Tax=Aspergillus tanneri TaxID=1220188 RepID=A0A4S3J4W5_9EURO|nr:hypothetical protein EYZ11_012718 [Aspergillus tanneri]